jgi:(S)-mandelate dehydrogenase
MKRFFRRPAALVEASATGSRLTPTPATLDGMPGRSLYRGDKLSRARTIADLRAMAHHRLPAFALEYLEGGAEEEATLARNLSALASWRLLPSALVNVSERELSTNLFGERIALPLAIAPTGLNGVFWDKADLRLASASARANIPFIQSTLSNDSIEDVARIEGLRHWWQLYVFGERRSRVALVKRAEEAGCEALVVTVDAQFYGDREWEQRRFSQPGVLTLASILEAALHPHWLATTLIRQGMPSFVNILDFVPKEHRGLFASAFWVRANMDRGLDWEEIARIRALWPRKLLIKGILNPRDVCEAARIGAEGVILSNHGGRQLDWTIAGLDSLREARRLVGRNTTLIVDGGMRRGTDVLKALALGADAVLIGRAALYGLCAAGGPGVTRAIEIFREEIDRDLGLLGAPSIEALGPVFLTRC